jgi:hypothetical protein
MKQRHRRKTGKTGCLLLTFDPRDVEGHWTEREDQPTSMEVEESDNDSEEDDETIVVAGVHYQVSAKRKRGNDMPGDGETIKMGEVVVIGDLRWKRIEGLVEDARTEPHLPTTFKTNLIHDETREVDVFEALMPISKENLLKIVRENSEELNDGGAWIMWMIDAALTIIFGGAQFKDGTDLWATNSSISGKKLHARILSCTLHVCITTALVKYL